MGAFSGFSAGLSNGTLALLHRFRRLALRYERRADNHEPYLTLGGTLITWR